MKIYLIRHPSVDLPNGVCYGSLDPPLTSSFSEKLTELKKRGRQINPDICYSSPLTRCLSAASQIFESDIQTDKRLTEMDFGRWEGKKWSEISSNALKRWMKVYTEEGPPGGESFKDLQARVVSFWNDMIKTDHDIITIVTHAGVIRGLLSHLLHIPLEKVFAITIDLNSITSLEKFEKHTRIDYINRPLSLSE